MPGPAGLLPGTLDLLILKAVSLGHQHGYGVLLRIEQISRGCAGYRAKAHSIPRCTGLSVKVYSMPSGCFRKQSPGQVLQPDCRGAKAPEGRD